MSSMRVAVFLLASVCVSIAFQCYIGSTTSKKHPSDKTDCTSHYCAKLIITKDGTITYNYGCDLTDSCRADECRGGDGGIRVCCCGTDLCNASTTLSTLFAVVPLMKILAF